MGRRAASILWIVTALLAVSTIVLLVVDFAPDPKPTISPDLAATISKAATYFDFEHYQRAADTYRTAIAAGMDDPHEWFRYARALELAGNPDLAVTFQTYTRLLFVSPDHEHTRLLASSLAARAQPFDYRGVAAGSVTRGDLVRIDGTVSMVVWGTVSAQRDTVVVETRPDRWVGHLGDRVVVDMPRLRRLRNGDGVSVIARYDGSCDLPAAGGTLPCFTAAGPAPADG
ncbi:MAG: hypothetical protein EA382_12610 [Spirochaetaceae bacterium]|nr:MAG: hypothetical protein EA382_12610 [Spirochaetaceae bacterium]